MLTYDINTSDVDVGGTPPGRTYQPLRYTATERDTIRVGLWMQLSTIRGTYRMRVDDGLDAEALLDPTASDPERRDLVTDVVLSYPGVVAIEDGPTIVIDASGQIASVSVTALTSDGPIQVTA